MSMIGRLKYLYDEGFDICSIMGYDSIRPNGEKGTGKILYRYQNEAGQWRVYQEVFEVTYDEMQACSTFFLYHILN